MVPPHYIFVKTKGEIKRKMFTPVTPRRCLCQEKSWLGLHQQSQSPFRHHTAGITPVSVPAAQRCSPWSSIITPSTGRDWCSLLPCSRVSEWDMPINTLEQSWIYIHTQLHPTKHWCNGCQLTDTLMSEAGVKYRSSPHKNAMVTNLA